MAKQKVLFYTKNNHIVVLNLDLSAYDETRRNAELNRLQHYFLQYDFDDIALNYNDRARKPRAEKNILSAMDALNSSFINKYVRHFEYSKNRENYLNSVKAANFPPEVAKPETLHFDYSIDESAIPEFIKNLGFQIIPEEKFYDIDVEEPDFKDKIEKIRMDVWTSEKKIHIFRRHYHLPKTDYVRLRGLITAYEALSPKPEPLDYCSEISNKHDEKLFRLYANEKEYLKNVKNFALHEFHHVKNHMVFDAMMCKRNFKRLTPANTYRLEVDNERSAYMAQAFEAINRYLKGGNFEDYSMFDNFSKDIAKKLKRMSDSQKQSYLTDMEQVVNDIIKRFEQSHRENYDENQFVNTVENSLLAQPMGVPEERGYEQYQMIRSAFYSISVYNPITGKTETRNLSKYIRPENEVRITIDERVNIVDPAYIELQKKQAKFDANSVYEGVDVNLLNEARAMLCQSLRSPRIVSNVQTLNVAELADDKNSEEERYVPDDKANWSDDLQKYWKQFDGYVETAKNNEEYSFKIKDQAVKYTSKTNVYLGKSCHYEMYKRLVEEPSGAKRPIKFEKTLSKEQALMLYVACVNAGRKMQGEIPQDLSKIDSLSIIPKSELDKFKKITTSASKTESTPDKSINVNYAKPTGKSR